MQTKTQPAGKRQSVQVGPALDALLTSGVCADSGLSRRLDTLAARYATLINTPGQYPQDWTITDWAAFVAAVGHIDTRLPTATYTLIGYIKGTRPTQKLTYTVEMLTQLALHAMLALSEQAIAAGATEEASLEVFLLDKNVTIAEKRPPAPAQGHAA